MLLFLKNLKITGAPGYVSFHRDLDCYLISLNRVCLLGLLLRQLLDRNQGISDFLKCGEHGKLITQSSFLPRGLCLPILAANLPP